MDGMTKRNQHFPCAGCMLVPANIYQVPLGMRTEALISRGLWQRVFADGSVLNSISLGQAALPSLCQPLLVAAASISIWLLYVSIMLPAGVPSSVPTGRLSVTAGEPTALLGLHQPPSLIQHHPCSGNATCQNEWSVGVCDAALSHWGRMAFAHPHGCLGSMRRLCLVLGWSLKVPGELGVSMLASL